MLLLVLLRGGAQHVNLRLKTKEDEIPRRVVEAYRKQFEESRGAVWAIIPASTLENDFGFSWESTEGQSTYYDVMFMSAGGRNEVVYDHFGNCVGVKKPINTASLPPSVLKTIEEAAVGRSIVSLESVARGSSTVIHYILMVSGDRSAQTVFINTDGSLLKMK